MLLPVGQASTLEMKKMKPQETSKSLAQATVYMAGLFSPIAKAVGGTGVWEKNQQFSVLAMKCLLSI